MQLVSRRAAVLVLLLATLAASGCASKLAYRQGQAEANKGNWDNAVARYTKALAEDPRNITYKIALEEARVEASRVHYKQARKHLAAEELEQAIEELDVAVKFDAGNKLAADDLAATREKVAKRSREKERLAEFEALKQRAANLRYPTPLLSPRSQSPVSIKFPEQSLQKIFETLGKVAGVNVLLDEQYRDKKVPVDISGVTFEQALDQLCFVNRLFYKVLDQNSVMLVPDTPQKRRQYEDVLMKTFYLENAELKDVEGVIKTALGTNAKVMSNAVLGAVTIVATPDELALADRVISSNDKSKGEVVVEVEILEVNRTNLKEYGIALSNYTAGVTYLPSANQTLPGLASGLSAVRAQFLSSVNLSDFVVSVPNALFAKFLRTDSTVKLIAAPRLRGAEGKKTTLKIVTQVPVPTTTFQSVQPGVGGGAYTPTTTVQYKDVGVILDVTPKINAVGDILLEVNAEFSLLGQSVPITGTDFPTFLSRNVNGLLRLRDGETSLIGGLVSGRDATSLKGILGLEKLPLVNKLFTSTSKNQDDVEILISMTPHLVRAPQLNEEDLTALPVGTRELVRVPSVRPSLFGEEPAPAASPVPDAGGKGEPAKGEPAKPEAAKPEASKKGAPPAPVAQPTPAPAVQPTPAPTPVPPPPVASAGPPPPGVPQVGGDETKPPTPGPPPGAGENTRRANAVLSPPELSIKKGGSASLAIVVIGVQDVTGVELVLSYDAALLGELDVAAGPLLTLDGSPVAAEKTIEQGQARVRLTRGTPVNGSGAVATVTLRAREAGSANLALQSVYLVSKSGSEPANLPAPARINVTP